MVATRAQRAQQRGRGASATASTLKLTIAIIGAALLLLLVFLGPRARAFQMGPKMSTSSSQGR